MEDTLITIKLRKVYIGTITTVVIPLPSLETSSCHVYVTQLVSQRHCKELMTIVCNTIRAGVL